MLTIGCKTRQKPPLKNGQPNHYTTGILVVMCSQCTVYTPTVILELLLNFTYSSIQAHIFSVTTSILSRFQEKASLQAQ